MVHTRDEIARKATAILAKRRLRKDPDLEWCCGTIHTLCDLLAEQNRHLEQTESALRADLKLVRAELVASRREAQRLPGLAASLDRLRTELGAIERSVRWGRDAISRASW